MEALLPETKTWYEKFNQTRNDYNGGDFNGPQLRRLMKPDSIDHLKLLLSDHEGISDCMKYFNAMVSFVHLKKKTFGKYVSYCLQRWESLLMKHQLCPFG